MTDQAIEMSEVQRPGRANSTVTDTTARLPLPRPNETSILPFAIAWKHCCQAWTFQGARNIGDWIMRSRWHILGAFVTCLGTVVAMLALKPAFAGERSSARAMALAEWTATKDFFEYCSVLETKGEIPQTCGNILNETLPPPPHLEHSRDEMARLNAALPDISKREIKLRTAFILRHDELMSRVGFAITGTAFLLIYITRLYCRQHKKAINSQPDTTPQQTNPTPEIWRPIARRRHKKTPQAIVSGQEHNDAEIRYRGSQRPGKEKWEAWLRNKRKPGTDDVSSAHMRSDQYPPRDDSLLARQHEAGERFEAEMRIYEFNRASTAELAWYVKGSTRRPSEQNTTTAVLSALEAERNVGAFDIDEYKDIHGRIIR